MEQKLFIHEQKKVHLLDVDRLLPQWTKIKGDKVGQKGTEVKEDHKIEKILEELPEWVVKHAYQKLKLGNKLSDSEMKICIDVCKIYSTEKLGANTTNNI